MQKEINLPKVNIVRLRKILLIIFVSIIVFVAGYYIGSNGYSQRSDVYIKANVDKNLPSNKKEVDFGLFWRVWDTLETQYFDKSKLDPSAMVYGAIQGMVSAVGDPYTVYLPPQENKVVQEDLKGSFQGVGIQIGFRGTQLAVIAPLPDTPADEAGIRAGDYIIGIKDEAKEVDTSTNGMSLPDAVELIRGPEGTIVTLALIREGEDAPIIVDVERREINVPSVLLSWEGENKDIAHIRLLKFAGETEGEWEEVVRDVLKSNKLNGIVLDLRNNPGGYLQGAVDIAGEFLPNGTLVVIEDTANKSKREFKTAKIPRLADVPLVLLVNKGSASASEILAGALRDQSGIKLVGVTTFGKGTIQEPQQFEDGTGLHITTARWITPSEFWVNEVGLEPDINVEDNLETDEDEQLQDAIKNLLN
jgi:carboxyl-terminal processing protease